MTQELIHLLHLYDSYKLQVKELEGDMMFARGLLNQAIQNGYSDIVETLLLKVQVYQSRKNVLMANRDFVLQKIQQQHICTFTQFEKINLTIHLHNN